jgi:hypothetical protein
MGTCEVCGNEYDKSFSITFEVSPEEPHTFDSFECAVHAVAPVCDHCGCKILGHGVEADGSFYCCAHCAQESGVPQATDRIEAGAAR